MKRIWMCAMLSIVVVLGCQASETPPAPPQEIQPISATRSDVPKPASQPQSQAESTTNERMQLDVKVTPSSFEPAQLHAAPRKPVRVVFTRISDEGCTQQVVFPTLHIQKDLPLNEPVAVEFTMPASGNVDFSCAMGMAHGSIAAH